MAVRLHLLKDGRVVDAFTNLSVGCWHDTADCVKLFLPTTLEQVTQPKPTTHKGVEAELRGSIPRYREEAIYDPAVKRFRVKYIEV